MASRYTPAALTNQIEDLLAQRKEHQAAIDTIDATLEKIGSMLDLPARPGRPRGTKNQANGRGARRRKRGRFATSGEESILAFVRKAGSPTTKEVNQHWKAEGRGGTADNALTKLVKLKKLKRTNVKGQRGSQYAIA
jgi:ferric-dicitrate binding protein FerR (iron transport regulator)